MTCSSIATTRLKLGDQLARDLLNSQVALEAIRTWLQSKLGHAITLDASVDAAYWRSNIRTVLTLSVRGGFVGYDVQAIEPLLERFTNQLGVALNQQQLADAIRAKYVVDSDSGTAQGARLLVVNL